MPVTGKKCVLRPQRTISLGLAEMATPHKPNGWGLRHGWGRKWGGVSAEPVWRALAMSSRAAGGPPSLASLLGTRRVGKSGHYHLACETRLPSYLGTKQKEKDL